MYSASLFLENLTLACVDRGDVEEVWETLKSTLPTDLHDFIDYYERTCIGTLDVESKPVRPRRPSSQQKHSRGLAQWLGIQGFCL